MFADRLKELRKEKGMTQIQLAQELGVSKGTVAMWELEKRQPNFDMVNRLSVIFDRRIDYILGYSDDASSPNMTEEMADLARSNVEDEFYEVIMSYLALDNYGRTAVENLIRTEKLRCHEQQSLYDVSGIRLSIRLP